MGRNMDQRRRSANLALIAAAIAGVTYLAADHLPLPQAAELAWKGSGVGFLALYAGLSARNTDGRLICAVMALGAAGDVLLGLWGLVAGGAVFLAGHLTAVGLYLRNRRGALGPTDWLMGAGIVAGTVVTAFLLPADRAGAPGVAVYALGLSLMATGAWISRFPRAWVGLGAMMFVASDLLLFARAGPLHGSGWVGPAIWSLYFGGQALICIGVVRALTRDRVGFDSAQT